jgi:hypothetical protein
MFELKLLVHFVPERPRNVPVYNQADLANTPAMRYSKSAQFDAKRLDYKNRSRYARSGLYTIMRLQ